MASSLSLTISRDRVEQRDDSNGQLGRAPNNLETAVRLDVGLIPGHNLCERNTFNGAQKNNNRVMDYRVC